MLKYPKQFTDAEWKKAEKTIKVEATGIGKTLRDLEKAAKTLDAGCVALAAHKTDAAKVLAARKAHTAAGKKAVDTVHATMGKQKSGTPAAKYLLDFRHKLSRYISEVEDLDPANYHGIEDAVDRVNGRI